VPAPRMTAAQRREQLLDVLARIVIDEGYTAISIDRVAREAGIARTVVYSHFGSLDGLVRALIERTEHRALGQVRDVVPDLDFDDDPDAILTDAVREFFSRVRDDPDTWRLAVLPVDGAPVELRERLGRAKAAVIGLLQPVIEEGIRRRGGPAELDAELFSRLLVSSAEDAARLVLSDPETYTPERLARFTATLMSALQRA